MAFVGKTTQAYSTLKTNSWSASTSPGTTWHWYASIAARTAAWNTRGPDTMVTSLTTPSRIKACAFTTPLVPSCRALRGISGGICVGQLSAMSECAGTVDAGAGAVVGGGGGAMLAACSGGVVTASMAGAVAGVAGATSGVGTKGGGVADLGAGSGMRTVLGGGVAAAAAVAQC
ncbi:MAG: hypothetical protein IPH35_15050 [Rhodoferax sp.]|nr:hypothetical protein [Rhodoferax sp.]